VRELLRCTTRVPHSIFTGQFPHFPIIKGKGVPLQARCCPEDSRRFRLLDFNDIRHLKVVRLSPSRTSRLYPQECSWYSFSLGAESAPGPWYGRKDICQWKIQWHHWESIFPRVSMLKQTSKGRRSSFGIVTRLRVAQQRNRVYYRCRRKRCFSSQRIQSGSWAQPKLRFGEGREHLAGREAAKAWSWPLTSMPCWG
jgi:hypothetical protein